MRSLTRGVLASVVLLSACGGGSTGSRPLPIVEVETADGSIVSTESWIGEPLVVNFWFSTCAPCAVELRDFAEVDAETSDDDVRFIGVNPIDSIETMYDFAAERGVEYDLVRDPRGDLQIELELASFPTTVFVGSDGTVVDQRGVLDADQLRARIEELLAEDG